MHINTSQFGSFQFSPPADFDLFMKAALYAKENNIEIKAGNVLTQNQFYQDEPEEYKKWAEDGVLCVEMETAGIYSIAAKHNVNALSILTILDSLVNEELTTAQERETSFSKMIEIALACLD